MTIYVPEKRADYIDRLLTHEPKTKEECFGEDEAYMVSAIFPDGRFVDVMLCGVQFEEGECNLPWTQAVLYEKNGSEICFTDPKEEFFGPWNITAPDGKVYHVNVERQKRGDC